MENSLQLFKFEDKQVRTVEMDNEVYFVGKDVCDILGFSNSSDAIKYHCRGVEKFYPISDSLGRMQNTRVITEGDLNRLIMNSEKPEAKKFEEEVMEVILPTIRKTGKYEIPKPKQIQISLNADYVKDRIEISKLFGFEGNQAMLSANRVFKKELGRDLLDEFGVELISPVKDKLFTPTDLGKEINISAIKMNEMLQAAGFQTNNKGQWMPTEKGKPYCEVLDTGKKRSNGTPIKQLKWYSKVMEVII
jgi:prophage antirepressor-like protein